MWILFLLILGYSVNAKVPDPTLMYVKVGNQPVNLTSPGFPTHNYPPNLNRQYEVSTVAPINIALKMIIESIRLGTTCDDYLQIIEFNRPIYTFCGIMSFRTPSDHCPEPRKRIELLKMSFPTLDQSLP